MIFKVYPAIDIMEGRCVRLIRGEFGKATVYHLDPLDAALRWKELGARRVHVVDLDGARKGSPVNRETILEIAKSTRLFVQCGGGIRRLEDVRAYLENGVSRVILGSAALEDPRFLSESIMAFPGKIAGGLDLRAGKAALNGWTRLWPESLEKVLEGWKKAGLKELVVTDIERDGTLMGYQSAETLIRVAEAGFRVIASGGIAGIEDLIALKALSTKGVSGAVLGKALYDGRIDLQEALLLEEDGEDDAG